MATANTKAFQAFMARFQRISELLENLTDRSYDLFGVNLQTVGWQEVGDLGLILEHLESALEIATPEELDLAS